MGNFGPAKSKTDKLCASGLPLAVEVWSKGSWPREGGIELFLGDCDDVRRHLYTS
jgi:hypothetical protein